MLFEGKFGNCKCPDKCVCKLDTYWKLYLFSVTLSKSRVKFSLVVSYALLKYTRQDKHVCLLTFNLILGKLLYGQRSFTILATDNDGFELILLLLFENDLNREVSPGEANRNFVYNMWLFGLKDTQNFQSLSVSSVRNFQYFLYCN